MANSSYPPSRAGPSNIKTNDFVSGGIHTENATISAVANPRISHHVHGGRSTDEGADGMASVVVRNSTSSGSSALDEYRINSAQTASTDNINEMERIAVNAPVSDRDIAVSPPDQMVFEVAEEASDAYPPLNGAIRGSLSISNQFEDKTSNRNDIQKVILRIQELLESLSEDCDEAEKKRMITLKRKLDESFRKLDSMSRQGSLSTLFRNSEKEGEMSGIVKNIDDAIMDYQTVVQQFIDQTVVDSGHSTAALRQDVQQGIQDLQQGIQDLKQSIQTVGASGIHSSSDNVKLLTRLAGDMSWLDRLPHAKDAAYSAGDQNGCLDTTRAELLQAIEAWIEDLDALPVYWLSGLAGTGKSTIAQTVAERTLGSGAFGGSFFCFRGSTDRSNLGLIFPTLAYQLACLSQDFRSTLVDVIKADLNVGYSSLSNQLEKLFVEPLMKTNLKTVIIVDALDECVDNKPESVLLRLLSHHVHKLPSVKFFITGRPEDIIDAGFQLPALRPQTEIRLLHEIDHTTVDRDLGKFFSENFAQLVQSPRGELWTLGNNWPAQNDILDLVRKSAGLFIYADTTFKFIDSGDEDPRTLLQLIVNLPHGSTNEALLPVDILYTEILKGALSKVKSVNVNPTRASGIFERFRTVVGSVVLLFDPLSPDAIASLLNLRPSEIYISLRYLKSLIVVPTQISGRPIRILHKSFPDYITDQARCEDMTFYVDPQIHHANMVLFCLGLMKKQLRKNMYNLQPYVMNSDVEDLHARRRQYIGDALEYACTNWTKHLKMAATENSDLNAKIVASVTDFFKFRSLPWLEIFSVIDKLTFAAYAFQDIEQWLATVNSDTQNLGDLVFDCKRFLLYFFDTIKESSQHIYHTALPLCPATSLLRTLYAQELLSEVKVVSGIDNAWDSCVRTITVGHIISGLAISHRGDLIGVGTSLGECHIFDAASGSVVKSWNGGMVNTVAFSADDSFFASGKAQGQIELYDVQTGQICICFEVEPAVTSMLFAPKGLLLAFGTVDGVVRILDVGSETSPRLTLEEHTKSVESVRWSPEGSLLATGSIDGSLKIWDASTGVCLHTTQVGKELYSVVWSRDGSKIVVSSEGWIRIYGTQSYELLSGFEVDGRAYIDWSPKGDHLLYCSGNTVVVRNLTQDVDVARFVGRGGTVGATVARVAFSPNGSSVISADDAGLVKIRALRSGVDSEPDTTKAPYAVAFSPNGRLMATATNNGREVKLWDANTWLHINSLFLDTEQAGLNPVLAFSPDSTLIGCGFTGKDSMRIWNVVTLAVVSDLCGAECYGFCFSPDGDRIAAYNNRQGQLWDVRQRNLIAELTWTEAIDDYCEVAFFEDGSGIQISSYWKPVILDIIRSHSQSLPFEFVPSSQEKPLVRRGPAPYKVKVDKEWIVDTKNRRVCWIPPDYRTGCHRDVYGEKFAFCGIKSLALLDFSCISADVER